MPTDSSPAQCSTRQATHKSLVVPNWREEGKPSQDSLQYEKPPIPHTVPALNGVPSVGQALYYVSSCMNSSTPQKTLCSKADSQSHFTVEKTKAQKAKRCDL